METSILEWIHPLVSQFSLSYDVAVRNNGSTTATICGSNIGEIIFAATKPIYSVNPNSGEAMAAKLAIEEASH